MPTTDLSTTDLPATAVSALADEVAIAMVKKKKAKVKSHSHIDEPDDDVDDEQDWIENHDAEPEAGLQAAAQEVTQALVAAPGTGYAHNDTITLSNGVVLKVVTLTAGNGVISTVIVNPGSTTTPPANPVAQASSSGAGTGATFNLTWAPAATFDVFPGFTPIIPTSVFPPGGGVGSIGEAVATPAFPPPTPPPIGAVPVGPLVGPAVAAAAAPPSVAGNPLIRYTTGSATVPAVNGYFTKFTTAPYAGFPNVPPAGVPIVFSNIYTGGKPPVTPPSTPTTPPINVSFAAREADDADAVRGRHTKSAQRSARSVLP